MKSLGLRMLLILICFVLIVNLSACRKKAEAFTYKSSAPNALAEKIAGGDAKLKDSIPAVKEALSLGGIAVADGNDLLVRPAEPSASFYVLPVEAANLALDVSNPTSGLTLTELGKMLADMGWPFAAGTPPEKQLALFFSEWVKTAKQHPDEAASFTPLFLAEMAKHGETPVDLASGTYDAKQLRFSLLSLQLIAGAFDRLLPHDHAWSASLSFGSVAYAAEPCSDAKAWLGDKGADAWKLALEAGQIKLSDEVGVAIGAGLKKLGMSEAGVDQFSKGMVSLGIVSKIWKLISIYEDGKVAVTLQSDNPMQKSLPSEKEQLTAFKATAGVSDADWKAYKDALGSSDTLRSLRDCFSVVGLPTLPDLGDLAKDSANWSVQWRLTEGSPDNGFISLDKNKFDLPGQLQMKLAPDGDHSSSALLVVDLTPQKSETRKGKKLETKLTAQASLVTSSPPSLSTFVNAVKGGLGDLLSLTDALAEIAGGWIQDMFQPKAYATLNLEYYQSSVEWTGTISFDKTYSLHNSSGQGKYFSNFTDDQKLHVDVKLDKTNNSVINQSEQVFTIGGQANGSYEENDDSIGTSGLIGCNFNTPPLETITTSAVSKGTIQAAPINGNLTLSAVQTDGAIHYSISVNVPGIPVVRETLHRRIVEENSRSAESMYCRSDPDKTDTTSFTISAVTIGGSGTITSKDDKIQGSRTYKEGNADITVKWQFTRKEQ